MPSIPDIRVVVIFKRPDWDLLKALADKKVEYPLDDTLAFLKIIIENSDLLAEYEYENKKRKNNK